VQIESVRFVNPANYIRPLTSPLQVYGVMATPTYDGARKSKLDHFAKVF